VGAKKFKVLVPVMANPITNSLRVLPRPQIDPLLDLIDTIFPCLKEELADLSKLLSYFIEHDRLPSYKLRLESLSRDELESMRSSDWSLKELLEPFGQRLEEYHSVDPLTENDLVAVPPLSPRMSTQRSASLRLMERPVSTAGLINPVTESCTDVYQNPDPLAGFSIGHPSYTDDIFLTSPIVIPLSMTCNLVVADGIL
jgi:hypothetical protein